MAEVGEHELAGGAVLEGQRRAGVGVDQLGVDEAAGAECIPSWASHSPQSEAPMSPMPIASVTFGPSPPRAAPERRLAAAGLAGDEDALHGGAARSRSRSAAHSTR